FSGITVTIVVQFGDAKIPWWCFAACALTSGTTSHGRVHAKGVGLVDDDPARPDDHGRVFLRLGGARRADRDLHALEGSGLDPLDADRLAAERHRLADGALGREGAQLPHRELPLFEDPERGRSRGAGGADDRDRQTGCHQYWSSTSRTIRSAISFVPTVRAPGPAMSAVRWPCSSTRNTARSTRSASFSRLRV